jgi:hypothetical protein
MALNEMLEEYEEDDIKLHCGAFETITRAKLHILSAE